MCFATSLQPPQVNAASSDLHPHLPLIPSYNGEQYVWALGLTDCSSLYHHHLLMGQTPEGHPKEQGTT